MKDIKVTNRRSLAPEFT